MQAGPEEPVDEPAGRRCVGDGPAIRAPGEELRFDVCPSPGRYLLDDAGGGLRRRSGRPFEAFGRRGATVAVMR
jgi:hypothetical protein